MQATPWSKHEWGPLAEGGEQLIAGVIRRLTLAYETKQAPTDSALSALTPITCLGLGSSPSGSWSPSPFVWSVLTALTKTAFCYTYVLNMALMISATHPSTYVHGLLVPDRLQPAIYLWTRGHDHHLDIWPRMAAVCPLHDTMHLLAVNNQVSVNTTPLHAFSNSR